MTGSAYAKENNTQGFRLSNNEIISNSTYSDITDHYIDKSHNIGNDALFYAEINYQNGNKIENPIYAAAGFRIRFTHRNLLI